MLSCDDIKWLTGLKDNNSACMLGSPVLLENKE